MILTGEVTQRSDAERTKDEANAVLVKQGRRAGTGMAHGRDTTEGSDESKKMKPSNCCNSSAARRVSENADSICKQSNKETSETQDIFSLNFYKRFKVRKKKLHREPAKNYFPLPNCIYQLGLSAGAIVVYGYLLYIENRETYQCHL